MGEAQVIQFASEDQLAAAVADEWLSAIAQAQAGGRGYLVALSGGRITRKLFALVVQRARARKISFCNVEFFWADERCVPPDDPESNYLLADQLLFQPAQVRPESVHRIKGELDPFGAAQGAAAELSLIADTRLNSVPLLDLIFLGMGEDGHVASLFPGDVSTANDQKSAYLVVRNSPKPPPTRVTLGYAPIATAREVWVLVSGKGKEAAFRESLSRGGNTPLARVIQKRVATKLFTDISPV